MGAFEKQLPARLREGRSGKATGRINSVPKGEHPSPSADVVPPTPGPFPAGEGHGEIERGVISVPQSEKTPTSSGRRSLLALPVQIPAPLRDTLPDDAEVVVNWTEDNITEAARTHAVVKLTEAALQRFEDDDSRDEQEKTIGALLGSVEVLEASGVSYRVQNRILNVIVGLMNVRAGISDPLFEPKHKATPSSSNSCDRLYMFRGACVMAVKAREAWKQNGLEDAQCAFLEDLREALPVAPGSQGEGMLFPARRRGGNTPPEDDPAEIDRRRASLDEWAKPSTIGTWGQMAISDYETLDRLFKQLGANGPENAYRTFFERAHDLAKSLIWKQG